MASDILHIKDGYYFDVPKFLWVSKKDSSSQFKDWFIRLDDDFQQWEADRVVVALKGMGLDSAKVDSLKSDWKEWLHSGANHGKPLTVFIETKIKELETKAAGWSARQKDKPRDSVTAYLSQGNGSATEPYAWVYQSLKEPKADTAWKEWAKENAKPEVVQEYLKTDGAKWSEPKLKVYNQALSGKVMIPQPFGELRNAYEPASGFCISKFMIIEVIVAIICIVIFKWLAGRVKTGQAPKGKLWNMLEGMLVYIKDNVVEPAMGEEDTEKFIPFFWTIFFFIFGCNLMGMLPWVGSPTAGFGLAALMAVMVFGVGFVLGVREFGLLGYLKNICPSLGLPLALAVILLPVLWVIEFASLLIKHFILALRLVANMVAGHSVLLGVLGLAVTANAVFNFSWGFTAVAAVLITTALSFLELLVAFLQAAIFTFLAALFISSAKHHH